MTSGQQRQPLSAVVAQRLATIPAAREVVPSDPRLSARWHMHSVPSPYSRWNYHPEYEVHLIRFGTGRYIVGDRIDVFSAGQLVLVGSNLPHHWISDLEPGEIIVDRDVVFQFHPDWIRRCQAVLPELGDINPLLKRSARGIEFTGRPRLRALGNCTPSAKRPAQNGCDTSSASSACSPRRPSAEHQTLAKAWLPPLDEEYAADIIDRAFAYILDNLVGEVRLSTAAELIGMSESAFSKYLCQTVPSTAQTGRPGGGGSIRVLWTSPRQPSASTAPSASASGAEGQARRNTAARLSRTSVPGPGAANTASSSSNRLSFRWPRVPYAASRNCFRVSHAAGVCITSA